MTQDTEQYRAGFEAWWEQDGQYSRAGGGDYEKTFAYNAWIASKREARYSDYVKECREHGLKPSSFDVFKVVCAEVERDLTVQVLIRCRHPAGALSDDAKPPRVTREMADLQSAILDTLERSRARMDALREKYGIGEDDAKDAAFYRELRGMHWSDGKLAVVQAADLKLGVTTYSGDRLDAAIEAQSREQKS